MIYCVGTHRYVKTRKSEEILDNILDYLWALREHNGSGWLMFYCLSWVVAS